MAMDIMKTQKKTYVDLAQKRELTNMNYKVLLTKLNEYENSGLDFYTDSDKDKRIISGEQEHIEGGLCDVKEMPERLGNPYKLMYKWIQYEISNLMAMKECIDGLSKVTERVKKL